MVLRAMAHFGHPSEESLDAFNRLRNMGGGATTPLIHAVNHPSPDIRRTAIHLLAYRKDPRSFDAIAQATQDREWLVRYMAIETLENFPDDPRTTAHFGQALEDKNESVQQAAIWGLVHLSAQGNPEARTHLIRCFEDQSLTGTLMGILNEEVDYPVLLLEDLDALMVKGNLDAIYLAEYCRNPRTADVLARIITEQTSANGTTEIARTAAQSLLRSQVPECQSVAATMIESDVVHLRRVLSAAANSVFPKPSPYVQAALVRRLQDDDPAVIAAAIEACVDSTNGGNGFVEAYPRIIELLAHPEPVVRRAAVRCTGNLTGHLPDVRLLHQLLSDSDESVRLNLVHGLEWYAINRGGPDRVTVFLPILADPAPAVLERALNILQDFHAENDVDTMIFVCSTAKEPLKSRLLLHLAASTMNEQQQGQLDQLRNDLTPPAPPTDQ